MPNECTRSQDLISLMSIDKSAGQWLTVFNLPWWVRLGSCYKSKGYPGRVPGFCNSKLPMAALELTPPAQMEDSAGTPWVFPDGVWPPAMNMTHMSPITTDN